MGTLYEYRVQKAVINVKDMNTVLIKGTNCIVEVEIGFFLKHWHTMNAIKLAMGISVELWCQFPLLLAR